MPAQPVWHHRVPEILEILRGTAAVPFLDRPAVERLFQVSRRQAIRLMGAFGGYQVGRTFLVDRGAVIGALERLEAEGAIGRAVAHRRRVLSAVNEASREAAARRTTVRAGGRALARHPEELPEAIRIIEPGRVEISYRDAEDLLAQVVELVSAASNDFPRFRALFEDPA